MTIAHVDDRVIRQIYATELGQVGLDGRRETGARARHASV